MDSAENRAVAALAAESKKAWRADRWAPLATI